MPKRTALESEEQAEDLYEAMSTTLRRRILASPAVDKVWRKTDPKVIITEMEKICLPPINLVVERQEFHRMVQGIKQQ